MKKHFFFLTVVLFFATSVMGQSNQSMLVRTWKGVRYVEMDGRQYPIPEEMKNDYLQFNSDSTYESLESGQLLIKGTWTFDTKKSVLTMKQNKVKEYPAKIDSKIIKLTVTELVMEGKDAEGKKLTIYFMPKK